MVEPPLLLRLAGVDDDAAIAALAASAEDVRQAAPSDRFPLHARDVRRWLEHERRSGFVLEEGGSILAYGELNPEPDRELAFWIGHLMVRTDRRDQGVGRRVVMALLHHGFVTLRARTVRIGAFDDNPAALACYRACGFREIWRHDVDGRTLVDLELPRARALGLPRRTSAERWKPWALASATSMSVAGTAGFVLGNWRAAAVAGLSAGIVVATVALAMNAMQARAADRRRAAAAGRTGIIR